MFLYNLPYPYYISREIAFYGHRLMQGIREGCSHILFNLSAIKIFGLLKFFLSE